MPRFIPTRRPLVLLIGGLIASPCIWAQLPPGQGIPGGLPPPQLVPQQVNQPAARDSDSRRHAQRPTVTIREFRSSVAEVPPRAATDLFITALVESGRFRVVERARLSESIGQEKLLNQQGLSSGDAAQVRLVAARYVFEGTISEAQINQNAETMGLNILGVGGKTTQTRDSIGIDVRVIEVESGIVADAIKVRRQIKGRATEVGGVGDSISNALSQRFLGGAVMQGGNKEYESVQRASVDEALRAAIDEAVKTLAERFAE